MLQKRHKEFQRRMSRHWLKRAEEEETATNPSDGLPEGRTKTGHFSDENGGPNRQSSSQTFRRRNQTTLRPMPSRSLSNAPPSNRSIPIFVDSTFNGTAPSKPTTNVSLEGSEHVTWENLGTMEQTKKENTGWEGLCRGRCLHLLT